MVEVETYRKLKILRVDHGGKFTSIEFINYFLNHGVPYNSLLRTVHNRMELWNDETR